MKLIASLFLAGVLLIAQVVTAQTPPSLDLTAKTADAKNAAPVTAPLGVGTAINASLVDTLDARRARAGDPVTAEVVEDVTYQRSVIFPKGTKIIGHILRATSGGRGRAGSALFIQFDRAVLKNGEEVILNAGIQALAVGTVAPSLSDTERTREREAAAELNAPAEAGVSGEPSTSTGNALIVSTIYDTPRRLRTPLFASTAAEGELNSDGLFTPESKGAFGRPDVKVYTPTSEGSHGTVLLSSKKNMHLDSGTRLLLVVQPPSSGDAESPQIDLNDLTPNP